MGIIKNTLITASVLATLAGCKTAGTNTAELRDDAVLASDTNYNFIVMSYDNTPLASADLDKIFNLVGKEIEDGAIRKFFNRNRESTQNTKEKIRSVKYDLKDPKAVAAFQKNVIDYIAKDTLIESCDTHDTFGKSDKPREVKKYKF